MSNQTKQAKELEKINRADRLLTTISLLEEQIKQISEDGEVAPSCCRLVRYKARGKYKAYWYYKLQASQPIFICKTNPNKLSRYKHLGSAGSQAHIDALMMVLRISQIDELQKTIDALRSCWSDLYSNSGE